MAQKMSIRGIMQDYSEVYYAPYCDLYYTLGGSMKPLRIGYNSGVYGWNCDIFRIWRGTHWAFILTGYRAMRGKRIPPEFCKRAEEKAKAVSPYDFNNMGEYWEYLESLAVDAMDETDGIKQ